MRHIVDVAFRLRAWDGVKEAAKAAGKPAPPPRMVVELLRGMVGKTGTLAGSLFDGIDDEQEHAITRVGVTLDWFAKAGCPIVSVDEETARGFASSPPPREEDPAEWPLGVAYGLSIGQGVVLVRHQMIPTRMPESMRPHFEIEDGVVPMEAWSAGVEPYAGEDALANLTGNIGAAIAQKPDGLTVTERHPSHQAARKQGLNPDHIPAVEYVIGSEIALGPNREPRESTGSSGSAMRVRTVVSPHWTHQVCGTRGSQRRLQWIASHWRGPDDAPISVHAVRVLGRDKPPDSKGDKK
jgi:hypothetical protein